MLRALAGEGTNADSSTTIQNPVREAEIKVGKHELTKLAELLSSLVPMSS